ncbi:MAG: nucleoside phosphorylase [Bacteroidales bacterium]|jgi:uridine phosphorylase|nr:nucleoside phosphorylase [Bacteroidales bacterium]
MKNLGNYMEIKPSEMPLQADGSVYHLNLHPSELADNVLLVGDPNRVATVSAFFDTIEVRKSNREINTHTGTYKNKRFTVLSTGMGCDNIDIVLNELDALVNIDLEKRCVKKEHKSLNIIRLGTCGGLQPHLDINTFIASAYGLGMDGLLHYYEHANSFSDSEIDKIFMAKTLWNANFPKPYSVSASPALLEKVAFDMQKGITITASGFYAPQCRTLRLPLGMPDFAHRLRDTTAKGLYFTNMEMETSALYCLSKLLVHNALTICIIIANRCNGNFSKNYSPAMENLIQLTLDRMAKM